MIYAYKEKNALGNYQTPDGTRYVVYTASRLLGIVKECWKEYESHEDALAMMQLRPVPKAEEITP